MKLIIPKKTTLALALSLISSTSFGTESLNLSSTLEQAIQNDPQWAATRHGYQANKENIHFASAGLKPSAKITGNIARNAFDADPSSTSDDNYNSSVSEQALANLYYVLIDGTPTNKAKPTTNNLMPHLMQSDKRFTYVL